MRRGHLAGLTACLWLAMCLSCLTAAEAPAPAAGEGKVAEGGATQVPAAAVVLRYAPKVGVAVKHKLTMAGRMEAASQAMDQPMRVQVRGSMSYTEKALSETADRVRVQQRLTGGEFVMNMGGQSQTQPMPIGKMVTEMDRRGRLVRVIEADLGDKAATADLLSGTGTWSELASFAALPEGQVKVGDTWSDQLKLPATAGSPEISLDVASRLVSLTTVEGRKCAQVRSTFSGPLTIPIPGGQSGAGSMQATLQGEMVWHYDYENSVYVKGEGTMGMDMKMSVSGPETPGMDVSTKMIMNIKLALVK